MGLMHYKSCMVPFKLKPGTKVLQMVLCKGSLTGLTVMPVRKMGVFFLRVPMPILLRH